MSDLELGMPRNTVLAGLAANYKLNEVTSPPTYSKGLDVWQVIRSGDVYTGDIFFKDEKLTAASIILYSGEAGDGDESRMVSRLFDAIYDASGQSTIDEKPGELTRTRHAAIVVESTEENLSDKLKFRTLKFLIGQKQYNLSVTTNADGGGRYVELKEIVLRKWQREGNKK